ncbi:hypothetical protein BRARA_G00205 [Brassica rapa]|uniref:RNase H type-1 domain-containing protein n=1 Tax=Brassica campestris TaxID=3711 RepID=A0A397YH19_BRACM|nr:hypothetical protein BRARA_G00205 [Brassica rapa]
MKYFFFSVQNIFIGNLYISTCDQVESLSHLLFECSFTREVWTLCKSCKMIKYISRLRLKPITSHQESREIARGSLYQEFISSPFMAEALAIRGALLHAISLNINKILFRSDCKGFVQAISSNRRSVELFGILSDIESSITFFSSLSFVFIPRTLNGPADAAAKTYFCNKLSSLGLATN